MFGMLLSTNRRSRQTARHYNKAVNALLEFWGNAEEITREYEEEQDQKDEESQLAIQAAEQ